MPNEILRFVFFISLLLYVKNLMIFKICVVKKGFPIHLFGGHQK